MRSRTSRTHSISVWPRIHEATDSSHATAHTFASFRVRRSIGDASNYTFGAVAFTRIPPQKGAEEVQTMRMGFRGDGARLIKHLGFRSRNWRPQMQSETSLPQNCPSSPTSTDDRGNNFSAE